MAFHFLDAYIDAHKKTLDRVRAVTGTFFVLSPGPRSRLEIFTLEMSTAGLAPGSYYLHIRARDQASGLAGNAFATLVIPSL